MYEKEKMPSERQSENGTKIKRKIIKSNFSVTVEPTMFIVMITSVMYQLVVQNLYLEKACRVEMRYNQSVCDAMTKRMISGYIKQQEEEVQKITSQMVALRTFIQGSVPFVVVIFAGSWSDRHNRRKPLILVPIIGEIVCCVLLILNTIFFYELPIIYTTLGDSIPYAIAGGWSCFCNGIFSYVGSTTRNEDKTIKMGIVTALQLSGALLGTSAGGFLHKIFGFIPFFLTCIILFVIAFVNGCLLLSDNEIKIGEDKKFGVIQDIFNVKYILSTFKTAFKSGPDKRRYKVIAVLLVFLSVAGPFIGELYMNYMYTRLKFSWDAIQYGTFSSIQVLIQVFGSFFSVLFFVKVLHWEDTFLGMISIIGSSISNFIFAFAPSGNYLYIGAICDTFLMTSSIAVRSLMSKIVPASELGQANSVVALAETSLPMIYGPLYTTVYKYTLGFFPGMFFMVSVTIKIFGLAVFIWLYREALKVKRRSELKAEKSNEEIECIAC